VLRGFRPGWAAASVARWIVPSGRTAAENFLTLLLVKAFHLCLFASLLLSAHVILIEEALGLGWWTFSTSTANILALVFLACAALLALRRLVLPHVRALTGHGDWLAMVLTVTPVLTGYLAYNQYFDYQAVIALHALSGTALIAALPFTKLSHTFMFFVSRAVTGSDFGKRGVGAW
jgi:nitrate reductase gamma subunit